MIDHAIRSAGIGGSEIAAIVGLDSRRDKFSVYAEKLGLIEREPPNPRMKFGKRLEGVIAEMYSEETGIYIEWHDQTEINPERPWQIHTVDAFAWNVRPPEEGDVHRIGIVDAKNVALDQSRLWGESGTDQVPDRIALQMQWYCSATNLPWADVAALFGGNDLRIYRIHRNAEIEAVILEAAGNFWNDHVLARVPPPLGSTDTAAEYLRQRFPRNTEQLRFPDHTEMTLLAELRETAKRFDVAEAAKTSAENAVREAIGACDGLILPGGKVTWKANRDRQSIDWEKVSEFALKAYAEQNGDEAASGLVKTFTETKPGPRVLRPSWPKSDAWMEINKEVFVSE